MKKLNSTDTLRVNISSLFTTLLTIAFIVLKLCHVIEWSWLWVLSPLWIPFAIILIIVTIIAITTGIIER